MSDLTGMGGFFTANAVICISSVVALIIAARLIYSAGRRAGRKDVSGFGPSANPFDQYPGSPIYETDEQEELTAAIMGALSAEMGSLPEADDIPGFAGRNEVLGSSWRIVSLREATQRGQLK